MDQRGSLKKSLAKEKGADVSDRDMEEFKSLVTEVLTPHASAILLDPEWGLPASKRRAKNAGLLLAYEKTGYDKTGPGRLPDLLANAIDQAAVVAFLRTIDSTTAPVFDQPTRPAYSSPIAINFNDRLIWSVNPNDDSVSVFRPDNNTRLAKIAVGDEPQSVALTPNGQYAYVANAAAGSVSVIQINDPAWGTFNATLLTTLTTGAEPWNVVTSPDGLRVFVANSGQDSITVIDATTRAIIGHVDLRNSLANDPDRSRQFQPRGLAVTLDNTKLYVTRFLSFTKTGGRQGDDLGKEGLVAVLNINTASPYIYDYTVARVVTLAPQITGFKFTGLTNPPAPDTFAFPNQLQSIVLRGDRAFLPNIAASPSGPTSAT